MGKVILVILLTMAPFYTFAGEWDSSMEENIARWRDRPKIIKALENLEGALQKGEDLYIIDAPYKRCEPVTYIRTGKTKTSRNVHETYRTVEFNKGFLVPENGVMTTYKAHIPKFDAIGRCKGFTPAAQYFLGGEVELVFDGQSFKRDKNGKIQEWVPDLMGNVCLDGSLIVTSRGGFDMECSLACTKWLDGSHISTPYYTIVRGRQRARQIARERFNGGCSK